MVTVNQLSSATTDQAAKAGISRTFYANVCCLPGPGPESVTSLGQTLGREQGRAEPKAEGALFVLVALVLAALFVTAFNHLKYGCKLGGWRCAPHAGGVGGTARAYRRTT